MNQRIEELAEQANLEIDPAYPDHNQKVLEKFAELIVKECINKIEANQFGDGGEFDRGCRSCSNVIKQHFGVEE